MGFLSSIFGGDEPPPAPRLAPAPNLPNVPNMPYAQYGATPNLPAPPSAQDIMDVFDELTGVRDITTVGADGKRRRRVMRMPRTPEQENLLSFADNVIRQTSQNLMKLYRDNPQDSFVQNARSFIDAYSSLNEEQQRDLAEVANLGNIQQEVQDFKNMRDSLLDSEFRKRSYEMENVLASKGLSNSTQAAEERAALANSETKARLGADIESRMYGEDMAMRRLGRNASVFGLREQGRAQQLAKAQAEFNLANQGRTQALNENAAGLQTGLGIQQQDLATRLSSQAPGLANQSYAQELQRYGLDTNRILAQNDADFRRIGAQYGLERDRALTPYQLETNRLLAQQGVQNKTAVDQYQLDLNQYNSKPPSFGDFLMNTAGTIGGAMLTGPSTSVAGRWGQKLFG